MSISRKVGIVGFLGVVSVSNLFGCGSVSNNDQGASFLSDGFFDCSEAETAEDCTPASRGLATFSSVTPAVIIGDVPGDGNEFGNVSIGVINRLRDVFVSVRKVDCRYEVPGSTLSIPSDSFPLAGVAGPGFETPEDDLDPDSSQVPGTGLPDETGNALRMEFPIISTGIWSFLVNNQNQLPQLPFVMNATCSVTGVSEAGDTLTTNEVTFGITFFDQSEIIGGAPADDEEDEEEEALLPEGEEGEDADTDASSEDFTIE